MNRFEAPFQDRGYQPDFGLIEDDFQDGLLHEFLPFSDLKQWIPENSVYEHVLKKTQITRLSSISALSFLSYIGPNPNDQYFLDFSHDRFDHSYTVALVMEKILLRNGFPRSEIDQGVLAALLHDIATPALGDATMKVDPEALDEEDNWNNVALADGGKELLDNYKSTEDEIGKIIKNKGVLGESLDISDRIVYTMKDLHNIISSAIPVNKYTKELHEIIDSYPKIGNIFSDVKIEGDQVFFTNPNRLRAFLLLRASLHEKLYLHPISQGRDLLVKKLIEPLYSRSGDTPLTPDKLRGMTDDDLKKILFDYHKPKEKKQTPYFWNYTSFFMGIVNWFPEYNKFETEQEAQQFKEKLEKNENVVVLGVNKRRKFDPATSYLVRSPENGKITALCDYDPEGSEEIEKISASMPGYFVYYKDLSIPIEPGRAEGVNTLLRSAFKPHQFLRPK